MGGASAGNQRCNYGGAAGGRHMAQTVFQAALGDDVMEADPFPGQFHDPFPHIPGLFILGRGAEQHGGAVDGAQTNGLGKYSHGVGGAVHAAGTAGKTDVLPVAGKGLLTDLVDVPGPDGFL